MCLRVRFERSFLCSLWKGLLDFWNFCLCLFLFLMSFGEPDLRGLIIWSFVFRKDFWINRVSASISLFMSAVVVSLWFILNLLQFSENVL